MIAVLQRVQSASVQVDGKVVGAISKGWLTLLGVVRDDTAKDLEYLCEKITHLRGFADDQGQMNRSCLDCGYEVLLVSQFTLAGDCRKGRRPSFAKAEDPSKAEELYLQGAEKLRANGIRVATGKFGASMQVSLVNDGPVTFILDSQR